MYEIGKDLPQLGRIYQALNGSDVRDNVFEYLCKIYPRKAFIPELSTETGHSGTNLKGALKGYGALYSEVDSLISLYLVESEEVKLYRKTVESFGVTEWGFSIKEPLKDYKYKIGDIHTHSNPGSPNQES